MISSGLGRMRTALGRGRAPRRRTTTAALLASTTLAAGLAAGLTGPAANAADWGDWGGDPTAPTVDPVGGLATGDPGPTNSFVAASFNVLGDSHTDGADPRPSGATRMGWTVRLLNDNKVDLVGLQEFEVPQLRAWRRLVGTSWTIHFPGKDPRDSIAWRSDRFTKVSSTYVKVPYKLHWRPMPVVTLRDRRTGARFHVMSVHNVAGKGEPWVSRRRTALNLELAKVDALQRTTGLPVIFVGDFNERTSSFFCKMSGRGLSSSDTWWFPAPTPTTDPTTGATSTTSTCTPPRRMEIDWLFRTPGASFTGYLKLSGGLVAKASDHPLVLSRVVR